MKKSHRIAGAHHGCINKPPRPARFLLAEPRELLVCRDARCSYEDATIEASFKHVEQSLAINYLQHRNTADYRHTAISFNRAPIVDLLVANHYYPDDPDLCVSRRRDSQQGMV